MGTVMSGATALSINDGDVAAWGRLPRSLSLCLSVYFFFLPVSFSFSSL